MIDPDILEYLEGLNDFWAHWDKLHAFNSPGIWSIYLSFIWISASEGTWSISSTHILLFHPSTCLFLEPPGQNINTIGNGYDDVGDVDVDVVDPINPFFPGTNENNFFPDDRGGSRYSQTGELTAQ